MQKWYFDMLCDGAVQILKASAPYDTGNLRNNAINIKWLAEDTIEIKADAAIAPYVVYTEEPWKAPRWHGKKNPNEGWFRDAVDLIVEYIAENLGGEVRATETENENDIYQATHYKD